MYGSVDQVIARTAATADTLGFSTDQDLRDFITTNLEEASDEIDRYCHKTFELQTGEVETRFGNDSKTIQLNNKPVDTINTVKENGTTLTQGTDYKLLSDAFGENNAVLKRLEDGDEPYNERWWSYQQYEFDYDWGYPSGNWPGVLDNVANEMVINRLNEAAAERSADGTESISMDSYSVQYAVVDAAQKGTITNQQLQRLNDLREPAIV